MSYRVHLRPARACHDHSEAGSGGRQCEEQPQQGDAARAARAAAAEDALDDADRLALALLVRQGYRAMQGQG